MPNNIKCYLCSSQDVHLFKNINSYLLYKCRDCKLIWVAKGTDLFDKQSFYDNGYFNSTTMFGYNDYLKLEKNHRQNAKKLIKTVDKFKAMDNLKILDIGCAYGFLLDEARKYYKCEVYGLELNEQAVEYGKNTFKLNILNCELHESNYQQNEFDIVFLIGIIEHIVDPRKLLLDINSILKTDGLIIITTIDTKGKIPLYSYKPPEHLFYFNHSNFISLAEACGYQLLMSKTNKYVFLLYDLFHRLKEYSSLNIFNFLSRKTKKYFPYVTITIPTNEMLLLLQKKTEVLPPMKDRQYREDQQQI